MQRLKYSTSQKMLSAELISDMQSHKKEAKKAVFDLYFGTLAAIASRYAKNSEQASLMALQCFNLCLQKLFNQRNENLIEIDSWLEKEFILQCVTFIKNIGSEYYVASTVHPTANSNVLNYNLFENNQAIEYNKVSTNVLILGLQKMVPAQRLVFNMHVIDEFSLFEIALKLETSEETVKSNLEKARYNFQKNIEKELKNSVLS